VAYFILPTIDLGWQLCDGSTTKYLIISSSTALEELDITLEDEYAGMYRKSGTYTGTATTATGASAGSYVADAQAGFVTVTPAAGVNTAPQAHTHTISGTSGADAEPTHIDYLPYFKR
jgi:hypothetical protein